MGNENGTRPPTPTKHKHNVAMTSVLCQMFTALLISSFSIILASRQFRLSLPIVAQSATGPSVAAHDPGRTVRPRHGEDDGLLVKIRLIEC